MAKLISTAAALLLLFAISHALTPSDATSDNNNIPLTDAAEKIPLTDAATTTTNALRLPSDRPGSEPVVELQTESNAGEKLLEVEFGTFVSNEENTADASKTETVPLTVISFRPVGRHFPRRPFPLGFRHGHRCRQGHRWTPRVRPANEIEKDTRTRNGDDMILSTGEELRFDRPFSGGARQIPARWTNFRHVGPRFAYKHNDEMESERPHSHHRHHRHHDHDFEMQNEGEEHYEEHKHGHDHGLFRSFRKFLNGF